MEDSLKLLEFNPLIKLNSGIIQSISANLASLQYNEIKASYNQYWNFRFINYSVLENVAKREKDVRVILDWLNDEKTVGLLLLHGPPGTGKTNYIRYLINKITSREFICKLYLI